MTPVLHGWRRLVVNALFLLSMVLWLAAGAWLMHPLLVQFHGARHFIVLFLLGAALGQPIWAAKTNMETVWAQSLERRR